MKYYGEKFVESENMNALHKMNSSRNLKQLLVATLFIWSTLNPIKLSAGLVDIVNTRGHCERDYAASAYPVVWSVVNQISSSGQISNGDFYYTTQYDLIGYNPDFAGSQPCTEVVTVTYRNNPNGPPVEQTRREMLMLYLKQEIRSRPSTFDPTRPEFLGPRPPNAAVTGVRASLDKQFLGINLTEASPDWAIRYVTLAQSNILAGEVVHMVVEAKGDEDWIELAANNTVFMKLQLTNFNVGQYYEIDVPSNLLVEGTNTYSYFLNSTGAANSIVFFPLALPEDAPPTIGSYSITNSVFDLQLTNLVYGFDYSIEQSLLASTNWQSVSTFTATNGFHSLSVSMTNSAMFYRAAIVPPP